MHARPGDPGGRRRTHQARRLGLVVIRTAGGVHPVVRHVVHLPIQHPAREENRRPVGPLVHSAVSVGCSTAGSGAEGRELPARSYG